MMIVAKYFAFSDFDKYAELVEACGCELIEHDSLAGTITVSGTAEAIRQLTMDLDYEPHTSMQAVSAPNWWLKGRNS